MTPEQYRATQHAIDVAYKRRALDPAVRKLRWQLRGTYMLYVMAALPALFLLKRPGILLEFGEYFSTLLLTPILLSWFGFLLTLYFRLREFSWADQQVKKLQRIEEGK